MHTELGQTGLNLPWTIKTGADVILRCKCIALACSGKAHCHCLLLKCFIQCAGWHLLNHTRAMTCFKCKGIISGNSDFLNYYVVALLANFCCPIIFTILFCLLTPPTMLGIIKLIVQLPIAITINLVM